MVSRKLSRRLDTKRTSARFAILKLDLYEVVMRGTGRDAGQSVLTRADFEFLLSPGPASPHYSWRFVAKWRSREAKRAHGVVKARSILETVW